MKSILAWLIWFALLGCSGTRPELPYPTPRVNSEKITMAIRQYTSRADWTASGYFRQIEDATVSLPVQVALARDGTACLIDNQQWANWKQEAVVRCQTAWRIRRFTR